MKHQTPPPQSTDSDPKDAPNDKMTSIYIHSQQPKSQTARKPRVFLFGDSISKHIILDSVYCAMLKSQTKVVAVEKTEQVHDDIKKTDLSKNSLIVHVGTNNLQKRHCRANQGEIPPSVHRDKITSTQFL